MNSTSQEKVMILATEQETENYELSLDEMTHHSCTEKIEKLLISLCQVGDNNPEAP